MEKLVHFDLSDFMKGRLSADNIRRLVHIIHETCNLDIPCAVVSLDAHKAFDQVQREYPITSTIFLPIYLLFSLFSQSCHFVSCFSVQLQLKNT